MILGRKKLLEFNELGHDDFKNIWRTNFEGPGILTFFSCKIFEHWCILIDLDDRSYLSSTSGVLVKVEKRIFLVDWEPRFSKMYGGCSESNPNAMWLSGRGMWFTYVFGVLALHIFLLSVPWLTIPWAWTMTNMIHNVVSRPFCWRILSNVFIELVCLKISVHLIWILTVHQFLTI